MHKYLNLFLSYNELQQGFVLDATRLLDGRKVVIKRAKKSDHAMLRHLNNPELYSDPRNHVIPLLDSFPVPDDDHVFGVLPYMQVFKRPEFHCRKEFAEALRQILEVKLFLSVCDIAYLQPSGTGVYARKEHCSWVRNAVLKTLLLISLT